MEENRQIENFLLSFAYWNAAHGAADVSGVGVASESTYRLLKPHPEVRHGGDFVVRGQDVLFMITREGDFYCFGTDKTAVEAMAGTLEVEWFDMG